MPSRARRAGVGLRRAIVAIPVISLFWGSLGAPMLAAAEGDSGLYSEDQALRGQRLYEQYCTSCHGPRLEGSPGAPLAGATFLSRWADGQHTLDDLFYIIRTLMPYNEPGKLAKQQYADILAYVLKVNGYTAGSAELPPSTAVLKTVTLQPR